MHTNNATLQAHTTGLASRARLDNTEPVNVTGTRHLALWDLP